jgi:hypothetical protein
LGRESSRVGFSSNPKFRVLLKKVRCEPLFIIFLGFVLTGPLLSPLVSLCRIFLSEEVWGRESSRLGFRLTQNLGFS